MKKSIIAIALLILPITTFAGGIVKVYPSNFSNKGHGIFASEDITRITYGNGLTQSKDALQVYDLSNSPDPVSYKIEAVGIPYQTAHINNMSGDSMENTCEGVINSGQIFTCYIYWTDDGPVNPVVLSNPVVSQASVVPQVTSSVQNTSVVEDQVLIASLRTQIVELLKQLIQLLQLQIQLRSLQK